MKRSEINAALREMEAMCEKQRCYLPPFCHFTPEEWQTIGHEYDEVRDCMLGWDITDYGQGDFDRIGFSLITIRNGNRAMPEKYPKVYAEKLLYLKEGQYSPRHFHWYKTEDIINRGGGRLVFELYNRRGNAVELDDTPVTVSRDGEKITVPAGTKLFLEPGQSLTLTPNLFHKFYGEPGGDVMVGEVSAVNDDHNDNIFLEPQLRFPVIEEDEPPYRLLVGDLGKLRAGN